MAVLVYGSVTVVSENLVLVDVSVNLDLRVLVTVVEIAVTAPIFLGIVSVVLMTRVLVRVAALPPVILVMVVVVLLVIAIVLDTVKALVAVLVR